MIPEYVYLRNGALVLPGEEYDEKIPNEPFADLHIAIVPQTQSTEYAVLLGDQEYKFKAPYMSVPYHLHSNSVSVSISDILCEPKKHIIDKKYVWAYLPVSNVSDNRTGDVLLCPICTAHDTYEEMREMGKHTTYATEVDIGTAIQFWPSNCMSKVMTADNDSLFVGQPRYDKSQLKTCVGIVVSIGTVVFTTNDKAEYRHEYKKIDKTLETTNTPALAAEQMRCYEVPTDDPNFVSFAKKVAIVYMPTDASTIVLDEHDIVSTSLAGKEHCIKHCHVPPHAEFDLHYNMRNISYMLLVYFYWIGYTAASTLYSTNASQVDNCVTVLFTSQVTYYDVLGVTIDIQYIPDKQKIHKCKVIKRLTPTTLATAKYTINTDNKNYKALDYREDVVRYIGVHKQTKEVIIAGPIIAPKDLVVGEIADTQNTFLAFAVTTALFYGNTPFLSQYIDRYIKDDIMEKTVALEAKKHIKDFFTVHARLHDDAVNDPTKTLALKTKVNGVTYAPGTEAADANTTYFRMMDFFAGHQKDIKDAHRYDDYEWYQLETRIEYE